MKWVLATPYESELESGLWHAVRQYDSSLTLSLAKAHYQHNRSRPYSSRHDWQDYWQHSRRTWKRAQLEQAGIITAFPQLASCIGLQKRLSQKITPVVAWTFNLGNLHPGYKQKLARYALSKIDRFIVHSSAEIAHYSHYLNLPADKFVFLPLHRALRPITVGENNETPFLLAMGTANRDYQTLFQAMEQLNYPLTIVAPAHVLSGLTIPKGVTIRSNLTIEECNILTQQARINIIPIDNDLTASGQVTLLEAMMYRRPVIATNTIGTRDYIEHGVTGLLTASKSVNELSTAIDSLWQNEALRKQVADNGYNYIKDQLNHEKTAGRLADILNMNSS